MLVQSSAEMSVSAFVVSENELLDYNQMFEKKQQRSHLDHVATHVTSFAADEDELPTGYFRSSFFLGSMTGIGLGLMAGVAGFGYAASILSLINADIGPDPNVLWVALSYTLTVAVSLTIIGRLSDIFGRRWIFIGGAVLGVVGSIVCATAQSINALIGGTAIIGMAASYPASLLLCYG
ncbi:hypothetical protein LTS18_009707 [Coniosporium uncinatum]|uniref:Uncharacterized protein n=1 Tax=Coniosporium uncinatum TaxID=93489 RepID=A0ACC3DCF6_9PEZI|nr:hypothetical protein LTS18_009707 [Coniosporium uncinatum]